MCAICRSVPCLSGCPNAPEPKSVLYCHRCGYGIYADDEYALIADMPYCETCLDDMATSELVTLLGGE